VTAVVEQFPYAGLFVLLLLGGLGLPFPEDTTLILCGLLISQDVIAPVPALITVYSGLLITDFMLYLTGKKYGYKIIHHRKFHRILSAERLALLEEKFRKWGMLIVLLGRHVFGLRAQLFLTAGILQVPAYKFILADAISAMFSMTLMIGAGYFGGNSLAIIRKDVSRIEHIAILLVLAAVLVYTILRYLQARRGDKTR
jgi:membrane-associated protein